MKLALGSFNEAVRDFDEHDSVLVLQTYTSAPVVRGRDSIW